MIRVCPSCGQQNRIPPARLADPARCGRCKATIGPLDEPVEADPALFDDVVRSARVPVLVDFWAEWCGPCKATVPEVAAIAKELAGRALVLKVNTDRHPELAQRYGVRGIPMFVVVSGGRTVQQQVGAVDRRRLRAMLEQVGAAAAAPPS